MKHVFFTILFVAVALFGSAQLFEGGLIAGSSYYVGDLNPDKHLGQNSNIGYGLNVRYVFNTRTALRLSYLHSELEADDALSGDPVQVNRNLHFFSPLDEIALTYEINFVNYALGDRAYWISPYIFGGLAYFRFNPMADISDSPWELRPLGTEGQHLPNSQTGRYNRGQISIPFGIGIKLNPIKNLAPFKWMSLNIEYGLRRTFTDYIDDVSGYYADPDDLNALTGRLADQSIIQEGLGGNNNLMERGNVNTKDWYGFLGVSLNLQIGNYGRSCKHLYE